MTLTAVSTTNAVRTGTCLVTAEALRTVTALRTLNAAKTSICLKIAREVRTVTALSTRMLQGQLHASRQRMR